jgi:hypothetical protein
LCSDDEDASNTLINTRVPAIANNGNGVKYNKKSSVSNILTIFFQTHTHLQKQPSPNRNIGGDEKLTENSATTVRLMDGFDIDFDADSDSSLSELDLQLIPPTKVRVCVCDIYYNCTSTQCRFELTKATGNTIFVLLSRMHVQLCDNINEFIII